MHFGVCEGAGGFNPLNPDFTPPSVDDEVADVDVLQYPGWECHVEAVTIETFTGR